MTEHHGHLSETRRRTDLVMAVGLAFGAVVGRHHLASGRLALLAGLLATNSTQPGR